MAAPTINRIAIDPENLADYMGRRGPKLHHVTTREAVDSIREHGLVPGSQRGYRIHSGFFATRADHVYLGDLLTVGIVEVPGERVLLAVDLRDLEPELVDPDEDEVQQSYFRSDGPWLAHDEHPPIRQMDGDEEAPGQDGVLAAWADTTEGFDAPEITAKSLERGRIAYRGTVPSEAIEEVHLPSEAAERFAVGVVPILGPHTQRPTPRRKLGARPYSCATGVSSDDHQIEIKGGSRVYDRSLERITFARQDRSHPRGRRRGRGGRGRGVRTPGGAPVPLGSDR